MSITSSEGSRTVAPLAGAWVEISKGQLGSHRRTTSLPSRERGLKSLSGNDIPGENTVAPLAGAWVEMVF